MFDEKEPGNLFLGAKTFLGSAVFIATQAGGVEIPEFPSYQAFRKPN